MFPCEPSLKNSQLEYPTIIYSVAVLPHLHYTLDFKAAMGSLSAPSIRRVAIVGSGPGGVVAAKCAPLDFLCCID